VDRDDAIVNSLVGKGAFFRGDIELSGQFRVDGGFKGSVKTKSRVIIGAEGRAECDVEARVVIVGGVLKGQVYATERVEILPGGVVIGDIHAPKLIADKNVTLNGEFVVSGPLAAKPKAEREGPPWRR
jgi:cytoskeletal protein CcmA (bactofilin family)